MSYQELNKGKTLQRYLITKPGAKYGRPETTADGRIVYVVYSGPDAGLEEPLPNEVLLTAEDAEKLRNLKLVPLAGTRTKGANVTTEEAAPLPNMEVQVPADWMDQAGDTRKLIASKIAGHEVTSVKKADAIIREYINGRQQA